MNWLRMKKNYMNMIGLKDTGLSMLIQKGYKILELDTYFTSGPEETRAWTIQKNCTAPKAAGEIHTDFEKGKNSRYKANNTTFGSKLH